MRKRYREPVFSGGFTAFLLVLILIGCGVILYIAVSGDHTDGIAALRPPVAGDANNNYDYEPENPGGNVVEGNANTGIDAGQNNGNGAPPTSGTSDSGHTDNGSGDNSGAGTDSPPGSGAGSINLLTQVDNTLLPWYLKLVNRYNFLDYYFYPQLTYLGVGGGHMFDTRAYRALLDMLESARSEGLDPIIASSFRSVSRQTYLFDRQVQRQIDAGLSAEEAFEAARRVVAYPGTSEHNLGLAVDIVSNSYHGLTANQASTPEGIWLAANSYRYGFVVRYPYYQQHITNIIFEPWHFRYVGIPAATEMFERGLVLEEFVSELLAQTS